MSENYKALKTGVNLHDYGLGNSLQYMTPKSQAPKTNRSTGFPQNLKLLSIKEHCQKSEKTPHRI